MPPKPGSSLGAAVGRPAIGPPRRGRGEVGGPGARRPGLPADAQRRHVGRNARAVDPHRQGAAKDGRRCHYAGVAGHAETTECVANQDHGGPLEADRQRHQRRPGTTRRTTGTRHVQRRFCQAPVLAGLRSIAGPSRRERLSLRSAGRPANRPAQRRTIAAQRPGVLHGALPRGGRAHPGPPRVAPPKPGPRCCSLWKWPGNRC